MNRRNISCVLLDALTDTPVVFLRGARQSGKTTLVKNLVEDETNARNYVTLDSATALAAALRDPTGFLHGLRKPLTLDEAQRAPELMLAIKEEVDRERLPGRYLLTGSANVMALPKVADSLAGRMEILTLYPLSQGEIAGVREYFTARLFDVSNNGSFVRKGGVFSSTTFRFPRTGRCTTPRLRRAWRRSASVPMSEIHPMS
jgi:predicted AAA+ superfamily ATPase